MSNKTSQADRKGKGKALAVPKHFRKPSVRIIDGQEGVSLETISLQDTLQAEAMYSCGENSVTLQKVLRTDLMFQDRDLQTSLFILNYFLIIYRQLLPLNRKTYSKRPFRLWNYILLTSGHLLKLSVVNSLARRMEIQAPQRQNHSL
nr:hypothetical protein CFP56_68090 [Quercus suber]